MPVLVVRNGTAARRRLDIAAPATIGADSLPDDLAVLPHHAVVRPNASGGLDVELTPGAGAWINDGVRTDETFVLRPGDLMCLGSTWLELEHPVLTSASVMLHLELERLVGNAGKGGTVAPRTGQGLETRDVASVLLAAALWGMAEYGLIRLEPLPQEDPFLGGPFVPVGITPIAPETERYGIESRVIQSVAGPVRLDQLVAGWFPMHRLSPYATDLERRRHRSRSHLDPWGTVVDWAVDGMDKAGMLATSPQEKPGFLGMQTDSSLKSDSKIAVLRPEVLVSYGRYSDLWVQRWFRFHAEQQWFADALVKECARVLRRAQYVDRH